MDKNKLFRRINLGLFVSFGFFILFDHVFLGAGIVFTLAGTLSLIACYYNTEPLGLSISGFDYGMKLLLKEYYNRYFNLFWGLIELLIGIGSLTRIFS
jgi:hypothetical protein